MTSCHSIICPYPTKLAFISPSACFLRHFLRLPSHGNYFFFHYSSSKVFPECIGCKFPFTSVEDCRRKKQAVLKVGLLSVWFGLRLSRRLLLRLILTGQVCFRIEVLSLSWLGSDFSSPSSIRICSLTRSVLQRQLSFAWILLTPTTDSYCMRVSEKVLN
jgi:hypothetical protein